MFFYDYVVSPEDSQIGYAYFQGLPALVSREASTSALQNAVSAISLTSLGHRSTMDHLLIEGRRHYGRALRQANVLLSNEETITTDSTMALIMCLDFFEVCRIPSRRSAATTEDTILELTISNR